jgi:DNA-binding response OmpR family regulator
MDKKFHANEAEKTHEIAADEHRAEQILILEDEGDLTDLLKEYLESNSYHVTTVSNGVEGLKRIMAQDYDVIICDMLMPHLPGDKFFIAVQKVKPHLCNRVVFMTGHKGDKKIDDFIRSVRGVMIWKPFQPHELLDAIRYIVKRTRER